MEKKRISVQSLLVKCLIISVVLVQLASSSPQESRNASSKSGRAIPLSKPGAQGKKVTSNDDEDVDSNVNSDIAFDNSPIKDNSDIVFKDESPSPPEYSSNTIKNSSKAPVAPRVNQNRWKKIPFRTLVDLGKETDVLKVLEKYVSNAKVSVDDKNNKILVDNDGNPLINSKNEKVIVAPAQKVPPPQIIQPRLGPPPSTRGAGLATASVDISSTRLAKQKPHAVAKQELCATEKRAVPVEIERPPHMIIIPRCVRVERCSGCCISELMECEPYLTGNLNFTIQKYAYIGGESRPLEFVDNVVVSVEQHLACSCKCKTKPSDCFAHHVYDESECSCKCKNTNDFIQCGKEQNKIWDSTNCQCLCREDRECSSGFYFDYNTCGCERETEEIRVRMGRTKRRHSLAVKL